MRKALSKFRPSMELLEDRINPAPTSVSNFALPSAGSAWDYSRGPFAPSPIVANIDAQPDQEIIVPGGAGHMIAYKWNGSAFATFRVFSSGPGFVQFASTPIVTAVPTSVAPSGMALFAAGTNGFVYGWDIGSGGILPGWPVNQLTDQSTQAGGASNVYGSLAAGDLNGDGIVEIVATSINHEVSAMNLNGTFMWRFNNDDTVFSGVAIGDLDHDGKNEVVFGGDSSPSQFYWQGGRITALTNDGRRMWVKQTDQVIWSTPALADLNNDGSLEVVVGTGLFYSGAGNKVYVLNSAGQDLVIAGNPGWPQTLTNQGGQPAGVDGRVQSSPAIGDVNGDGSLDIVIADAQGRVYAFNSNGSTIWSVQGFTPQNLYTSPVLADVDGDNILDVVMSAEGTIRAFRGTTGGQIWNVNDGLPHYSAAAVGDVLGTGRQHIVFITEARGGGGALLSPSAVSVYQTDVTTTASPWPMLRHNINGTGVARSQTYADTTIDMMFTKALGRAASAGERATWRAAIKESVSVLNFIQTILASNESRQLRINTWFQSYFGRGPSAPESTYLLGLMGNLQDAAVQASLLSSAESFAFAGGTNAAWVPYMYQKVLGRSPGVDPGTGFDEAAFWTTTLNNGTYTREQVTGRFLQSPEYIGKLIQSWWTLYGPGGETSPGVDEAVALRIAIRSGIREETVLADVLHTQGDYIAVNPQGAWLRAMYRDLLGRESTAPEIKNWLEVFEAGMPFAQAARTILNSAEYTSALVVGFWTTYLGRGPSEPERISTINRLLSGTARTTIIRELTGSNEYFANRAASNVNQYINTVFLDVLKRLPNGTEAAAWAMRSGSENIRQTLPFVILESASNEYHQVEVSDFFYKYVRRLPSTPSHLTRIIPAGTPFGAQDLVNFLVGGGNPIEAQVGILASAEYVSLTRNKAFWTGARWLS